MKGKANVNYLNREGLVAHSDAPNWDFIYIASKVKDPQWNIGDRVVLPDGRVYRYAKCYESLTSQKYTCASYSRLIAENTSGCAVATGGAAVGSRSVTLTVTAALLIAPGEDSATGILDEDELRGGYISLYRGSDRQYRGIIGNTALAAAGTSITIYLDAALVTALNAADQCEILPSPYAAVGASDAGWTSILGVPAAIATAGQYFWVQTWGICRITPQAAALGATVNEREFYGKVNGIENFYTACVTGTCSPQHLGFLVERTAGTSGDAAPFINLQINP